MPSAFDIHGTAFKNGSALLMARIVDAEGANVQPSGIDTIHCSVFEFDPCRPDNRAVVSGHEDVELDAGDVFFDSLQTGRLWTVDDVGYNFRHELDVSTAEAFPKAGVQYQVRYEIVPTGGQKTIVRFQLRVI